METSTIVGMLNDIKRRLNNFDVNKLEDNIKNGIIDKKRMTNFADDVYNLEEDLIIMDCTKDD